MLFLIISIIIIIIFIENISNCSQRISKLIFFCLGINVSVIC